MQGRIIAAVLIIEILTDKYTFGAAPYAKKIIKCLMYTFERLNRFSSYLRFLNDYSLRMTHINMNLTASNLSVLHEDIEKWLFAQQRYCISITDRVTALSRVSVHTKLHIAASQRNTRQRYLIAFSRDVTPCRLGSRYLPATQHGVRYESTRHHNPEQQRHLHAVRTQNLTIVIYLGT
jgi:hypothetical protein